MPTKAGTRALMIQGTGSNVGKSVIVAGLCRVARRRGLSVAPFKPQNMSNNAAVTPDGGEIGRAQALQALAAGIELSTDLNPVLLKPQSDRVAQVVLNGRALASLEAADYLHRRSTLLDAVTTSFQRLQARYDLVLVEGAGSPSEVNLRQRDIANMGFARHCGVPVCLLADIDRGGAIAALVGTQAVLEAGDADMIRAFLVNKFRGDPRLFDAGVSFIEQRTGWPCLGVIPWLSATARLPAEDAVTLEHPPEPGAAQGERRLRIVAPMLSRMANFDDVDPLRQEPGVDFSFIPPGKALPRDADVIILFGTKSTRADMEFLIAQGWHHDIHAHVRAGGSVLGLCGGLQMLGQSIDDPDGHDGAPGKTSGLGLLALDTRMAPAKTVRRVTARCAQNGTELSGYEIHCGHSQGNDLARPMLILDDRPEGARSPDGRIEGSYVHGLFSSDAFRAAWLQRRGAHKTGCIHYDSEVDNAIEALADGLEVAIDIERLFALAEPAG